MGDCHDNATMLNQVSLSLSLSLCLSHTHTHTHTHAHIRQPWNTFDFSMVTIGYISMLPIGGDTAGVRALRALRALRILRTITRFESLRAVVVCFFEVGATRKDDQVWSFGRLFVGSTEEGGTGEGKRRALSQYQTAWILFCSMACMFLSGMAGIHVVT